MKVVVLLEAGIPSYRNFLFNYLSNHEEISQFIVLHTDRIYQGKKGSYTDKKVRFVGSNKLGVHFGVLRHLKQADVIISSYNLRILSCWLPCLFFGKKIIFWGKGLGQNDNFIINKIRSLTAKRSRYILLYNSAKKNEFLSKIQIPEDRVIAYQNTIEVLNPYDSGNLDKNYFLYFGRIQERKGLDQLIHEYAKYVVKNGLPEYRLRIVGDGAYKHKLEALAQELNISSYVDFFPGVYSEDDIATHFKNAVAYVSPFNVGLAIINSFSYGVPVITCRKPQVGPEYFYCNPDNTLFLDDISDLSDAFERMNNNILFNSSKIFEYYSNRLHHSVMLENFVNAILKVK